VQAQFHGISPIGIHARLIIEKLKVLIFAVAVWAILHAAKIDNAVDNLPMQTIQFH
jgi:hypothetical protein